MRQQDNVSEMFVTCYLFLLYFITKDGRKLICFLLVYSQVTEMLCSIFPGDFLPRLHKLPSPHFIVLNVLETINVSLVNHK